MHSNFQADTNSPAFRQVFGISNNSDPSSDSGDHPPPDVFINSRGRHPVMVGGGFGGHGGGSHPVMVRGGFGGRGGRGGRGSFAGGSGSFAGGSGSFAGGRCGSFHRHPGSFGGGGRGGSFHRHPGSFSGREFFRDASSMPEFVQPQRQEVNDPSDSTGREERIPEDNN